MGPLVNDLLLALRMLGANPASMSTHDLPSSLHYFSAVSAPNNGKKLRINPSRDGEIKEVTMEGGALPINKVIGWLRFHSILTRNLIFVTNLYRVVRLKLHRDLVYSRDIIKKSAAMTKHSLTEFYNNQMIRN